MPDFSIVVIVELRLRHPEEQLRTAPRPDPPRAPVARVPFCLRPAPGSTVGEGDAAWEMPVLRSNHPLAVEGHTTTLRRFSEAGVMIVLDKSHCS